jgi:hypothetical protein
MALGKMSVVTRGNTHSCPSVPQSFCFQFTAEPRATISAAWRKRMLGPLSGLDHEINIQFVLHPYRAANGTDRSNPVVGLLNRGSAYISSIQFADG